jgi:hypothetical protein
MKETMTTETQLFRALNYGFLFLVVVCIASYTTLHLSGRGDELYAWAVLMVVIHGPVLFVAGTVGSLSVLRWRASRRLTWAAVAFAMLAVAATSITVLHR